MTEVDGRWDSHMPNGYFRLLQNVQLGVYWHLFCDGERINGGLCDTEMEALAETKRASWSHYAHAGHELWRGQRDTYLDELRADREYRQRRRWDG